MIGETVLCWGTARTSFQVLDLLGDIDVSSSSSPESEDSYFPGGAWDDGAASAVSGGIAWLQSAHQDVEDMLRRKQAQALPGVPPAAQIPVFTVLPDALMDACRHCAKHPPMLSPYERDFTRAVEYFDQAFLIRSVQSCPETDLSL